MYQQYGLKRTPFLRICKVVSILLFFAFIVCFFLMFFDVDYFDSMFKKELTEEEKNQLLNNGAFKIAVRLVYELETNQNAYGLKHGIKSITHIVSQTRNSYGNTYNRAFLRVEKGDGSSIYFEHKNDFELTTSEIYNSFAKSGDNKFLLSEERFVNAQLAYIHELLHGDNPSDFIYSIKKDEVTSKKFWKIVLNITRFSEIRKNANNIQSIAVSSPYTDDRQNTNAVIMVTLEEGDRLYYALINNNFSSTDSQTYGSLSLSSNTVYYTDYDLEVLFKESGIWQ